MPRSVTACRDGLIGWLLTYLIHSTILLGGVWLILLGVIAVPVALYFVSPVVLTDAVSMAAGLERMKFLPFIAATAGGTLPLTILAACANRHAPTT